MKEIGWKVDFDEMFPNFEHLRPTSEDVHVGKLKNARYVSVVCEHVHKSVYEQVKSGNLALTLGGDHSLAMGTISGSAAVHKDLGVIWVDAHAVLHSLSHLSD